MTLGILKPIADTYREWFFRGYAVQRFPGFAQRTTYALNAKAAYKLRLALAHILIV
jgi:hypothetical protein